MFSRGVNLQQALKYFFEGQFWGDGGGEFD